LKDTQLKDALFKHFWAQRCFVQPEVEIIHSGGLASEARALTDVDVFALRPHPDLGFERLLGDCRTLKSQSPVNRALWLSGLVRYVGARSGIVLLKTASPIEQDHKFAAGRVGILLFSEEDFVTYDKAQNGPEGSGAIATSVQDARDLRQLNAKHENLRPLLDYLYRGAWQELSFRSLIRHTVGSLQAAAGELDPAKREHVALLCDAAAIFSVGVADCAGRVFHQYLHPAEKEQLSESLRMLLWGGREQYQLYQQLRQMLLEAKGVEEAEQGRLDLPEWNSFVQLMRHAIERPSVPFHVPWILRSFAIHLLKERDPLAFARKEDLPQLRLAMLVISYVCKAIGVPRDFEAKLAGELVRAQSLLAGP
jgi:hypothetical protein